MPSDIVIESVRICDGSGEPSYSGSMAIAEGKIVAVGKVIGKGRREINGDGLVLAPGFIDPHTHYDAQVSWDRLLTPSCWHGITTVMMGNCGVGVAPCRPSDRAKMAWDLVNVEALPYDVLLNGVSWEWESFGEYMAAIEKGGTALNVAFLVPLSALRFYVMGEAASERAANQQETDRIVGLFREALLAGAMGFSLSTIGRHMGYQGKPLASRLASREELGALCRVMRDLRRGVIELALARQIGMLADDEVELLTFLAEQSQRPVTWGGVADLSGLPDDANERIFETMRSLNRKGLRVSAQSTPRPLRMHYDLKTPSLCGEMPSWKAAFNRTAKEQIELYRTPAFRQSWREDLKARRGQFFNGQWEQVVVMRVEKEHNRPLMNRSITEVARLQGKDEVDAYLDLAIDENLELGVTVSLLNVHPERMAKILRTTYPELLYGLSDAGAHVAQHCEAGVPSYLFDEWVGKRDLYNLETAIKV